MIEHAVISGLVFIFGAIVGSFLNVCIVRLPHEESVVTPRSHCVHCKTMIPWYDNIPFISYLLLGGRCRACKKPISFRYVLVEFLTACCFFFFYKIYGLTAISAAYLVMVCGFIVAIFVDFEHRIIPDEISVGGMFAGLLFSLMIPALHGYEAGPGVWPFVKSFGQSLLGVLVGGGAIYAMGLLGDFIFKKESMGGGDVKLLAMIGAFLGWKSALLTFFIAPFFGAVYGIVEKIRTKDSAIAYGPFLVLGALISMFYGDAIIAWIKGGYGLY
ncbi:MAG TPA: prepilin peptidase [Candidatus Omnitrophota bacterium]|nr:prepilin peptidase [Candidatus Omnitrophota bacterium]HQO57356.1 prepilin peptidase [Candidatus Omnitrophota bacterium]